MASFGAFSPISPVPFSSCPCRSALIALRDYFRDISYKFAVYGRQFSNIVGIDTDGSAVLAAAIDRVPAVTETPVCLHRRTAGEPAARGFAGSRFVFG